MNYLNGFHPGAVIHCCDLFCAFMEAHESIMYGVEGASLWEAAANIHKTIGAMASAVSIARLRFFSLSPKNLL